MRKIDHIIIHCAASRPSTKVDALVIDGWHRAKGWFGNGYHYVITREGEVQSQATGHRCRPLDRAGAHVGDCGSGWNARSIGICMAGGVAEDGKTPEDNFTPEQYASLKDLLVTLREHFPNTTIMGHRELIAQTNASPKACPSFDVAKWLETQEI